MSTEHHSESCWLIVQLNLSREEGETNLLQQQIAMKYALKARKLWYFIDGTVETENRILVSTKV